jgi:outer membrane protein OmpA-like peptidoglycan-associated protein
MNENEWVMSGDAEFYGSLPGLTLIPDEKNPKQLDDIDIDIDDDANFDSFHNGNGFAVDLGATYQLLPEVKLSASLLDFGFIHWNKNVGAVKKVNDWKYTGVEYDFTSDNNGDYFDKYQDSFDEAFEIDDINAYNSFLVPKLNLGGEYSFFEDKLGAGLLSRTFFLPRSVWEELVITANYRPVKRLTLSTGYSITNLRHESICFAANMTGGFFNVYFGIDNIPMFWGKVVDEYGNKKVSIPSRLNYMRINLGIGFALGGHRKDKDKKDKVKDVIEKFDTTPIVTDSDFDGVVDSLDRCPQTPEGVAVDANGCPLDADGDKVPDYLDKCPDTPAGATVDENGCPNDSDGDGVLDENDLCPDTPAGASVNEHGCSDSDGDGVPDNEDICAGTPSDASVDSKGCPIDTDGDGVPDYLDKCPTVAGPNNGCPEIKEEAKQIFKKALKGIQFASGKSVILTSSYSVLNQVVTLMKNNPEYKLTIKGHTDSSGDPAMNLKLSQERADAVKNYLVAKGIDANRLTAIGYGDKSPVADNSTQAGRAQNRRVELEAEY